MKGKIYFTLLNTILILGAVNTQANAADYRWQIRGAVSNIDPTSSPGSIFDKTAKVDIEDTFGLTGTIGYFVTPNVALDLLVGLPPKHDIIVAGANAATTKHLPPILSVQYHFSPNAKISPYIGAGINYTYFFDEKLKSGGDLHLSSSVGWAAQLGADIRLTPEWSVGADVRYADIKTDVKINGDKVGSVDVDPTIYSLNVGYRF
ncbi:hypothetical protein B9T29_14645 [Acinetobacter sp. ANC 3903]|uniref:OmpW/AlkL family protein n=1 Tax=Acinetobacter sp. ANC 3903 TaxID=1977883 RepID=UPI000A3516BA|nr:OmpW family outer membrane protein [Acinetobacter sp. ANC 3903]OTG58066.1 hypothetical protein B9T29_14645 [Acinetobacter sp. ANC 3903]